MELELLEHQLNTEREYLAKIKGQYESQQSDISDLKLFRDFAEDVLDKHYDEVTSRIHKSTVS